ncbi:MAG: YcnI family protein [OCS116 cluster bacterium]|uniref:YncI copper-binding domain-containing protein n=1 Tax=OCS116 cluster bacterium TaxID=2030921 RepID=A0A2A4Z9A6_9PROT|nr:YcnI family protein [OCS116 cluster bacterium]
MRKILKTFTAASIVATSLVAFEVSAHVTLNPKTADAGSYFNGKIRVPHGCGEFATTSVIVTIPDGILSVKPENLAGWKIEIVKKQLDKPVQYHGKPLTEVIDTITWSGGNLPNEHYKDFGLNLKLPNDAQRLFFKTTQICTEGKSAWDGEFNTPEERSALDKPSPYLDTNPADMHSGHVMK